MIAVACPQCGKKQIGLAQIDTGQAPRQPQADDPRLCASCGEWAIYASGPDGLILRLPTAGELAEIHSLPEVRAARAALRGTGPAVTVVIP